MFENVVRDFDTHGRSLRSGGFWTLAVYRFGRWSMGLRSGPARRITSYAYSGFRAIVQLCTGVLLERETEIGEGFHIVHAGMISIHPATVIGKRVGVMHGVTLGTNMDRGAPVIGDDVFIGCNASVLGDVTVGSRARISANSLVIADVPPGGIAVGVPARAATLEFAHSANGLANSGRNGRSS